jgi:hypothetical protein
MIAAKRPGTGLPPTLANDIAGLRVIQDVPEGTVFTIDLLR